MRHMGVNFYDHFKNRNLMLLFKRLSAQNQQRKFNALWKLLDEMTAKHIEERDIYGTSTADVVCAYGTATTDGIPRSCGGGAFSRRHTFSRWYEFLHSTESLQ